MIRICGCALLSPGPARRFFALAPFSHRLIYHREQIEELRLVASRPRLQIEAQAVDALIARMIRYGERVDAALDTVDDCRDPQDNYVLGLGLSASVDTILTEDRDLLVLDPWRGIRIMRLVRFLEEHPLNEFR